MKPCVGQRVRRTAPHAKIAVGMLGTIDVVHEDGRSFWVCTDEGGFNGWTSFDQWAHAAEAAEDGSPT